MDQPPTSAKVWTVEQRDVLGVIGPWRLLIWHALVDSLAVLGPFWSYLGIGEFQISVRANTGETKTVICNWPHKPGTLLSDGDWKYEVPSTTP